MVSFRLAVVAQLAAVVDYVSGAALIAERVPEKAQFRGAAGNRFLHLITTPLTGSMRYTAYKGNGSIEDGWPAQGQWLDFRTLWVTNQRVQINKICDNTEAETGDLYKAIFAVSKTTGVDPRFILAVMMNESRGCVRVQTTSLAVSNPGLMQSYEGRGSCSDPAPLTPCPYKEIEQMVTDGVAPNEAGVNLQDLIARSNATGVEKYYIAARMYNSGPNSISSDKELSVGGADACGGSTDGQISVMQRTWRTGYLGTSATAVVPQITANPLLNGVQLQSPAGIPQPQQQLPQRSGGLLAQRMPGGLLAQRMPGGRPVHSPHGGNVMVTTVAWVSFVQSCDNARPSAAYGAFWMSSI
uniref:Transglycosylase SLT domain-containing protein n=1 Tax=Ramularia collo-cygni TaxID=112498 RepID=A0A2D3VB94_9PEZI